MKLNERKTKNMIFNFSKKNQFVTSLSVNEERLELVSETKLLGTILTSDLKWGKNTRVLVQKAWKRMQLLNRSASFTTNIQDLKSIYLTYIRSILEQSAVVWHSSLTSKNRRDLERVQKVAVRVILQTRYTNYQNGLKMLKLETLEERRKLLCLRFAKGCLKNEKVKSLFPKKENNHKMKKRKVEKYKVNRANTKRYKMSAIPYMQRLMNENNAMNVKIMK